jgi:hypothetical protein
MSELDAASGGLRLSFEVLRADLPIDSENIAYEVKLSGPADELIALLRLPSQLVQPAVLRAVTPAISMAPDGELSVRMIGMEDAVFPETNLAIDSLVEQALESNMLEDEPEVSQQLQRLRGKLQRALSIVDEALGSSR